jgi:hypothetical protein
MAKKFPGFKNTAKTFNEDRPDFEKKFNCRKSLREKVCHYQNFFWKKCFQNFCGGKSRPA